MRVLLVRPRALNAMTVFGALDCEPLELEYLSAACREAGHEVLIYDGITEYRRFTGVAAAFAPRVTAVTGYLTQEREMERYAVLAKRASPGCVTVLGGVHVQQCWERLTFESVDYLCRSESTRGFVRLLSALEAGETPAGIPGLCRREGADFVAEPYVPCDVDELPLPDRSGWARDKRWFHYLDYPEISTLKTAVSCPFSCDFCYGRNLHGGRYQARRLDLVLDELERTPGETVFIVDSDFLLEEDRVRAFLSGLEARGIRKRFLCYARADFIAGHPELMAELRQAGFRALLVGIEAQGDERLEAWNKGTGAAVNAACIRVLRENALECVALLIADPAFTRAEFGRLYRWARDQGLRCVSVQVLTPLPATPYYERMACALAEKDFRRYDLAHLVTRPAHMSRRSFLARYWLLLLRLALLGRRRGAYRFVTPAYLGRALVRWLGRWRALS